MKLSSGGSLGALVSQEIEAGQIEERQGCGLGSRDPLGALVSLEVKSGLIKDRQRQGLVQGVAWEHLSH